MGINVPDLDDRTFEELIDDARRSIPVHTDAWTDHNVSDPGITILETLAWVAESDIYQLDRVTETHVRKYLQLLGVQPRPPQPASTHLALSQPAAAAGTPVETGEPLSVEEPSESVATFVTTADVTLTRASVAAVVSEHREGRIDNTSANDGDDTYFLAFGPEAERGSTMYVGFDEDPFATADRFDLHIDFHDEGIPDPASHGPRPLAVEPIPPITQRGRADDGGGGGGGAGGGSAGGAGDGAGGTAGVDEWPLSLPEPVDFEPTVEVGWQHCTNLDRWYDDDEWATVSVERDGTGRFYGGGAVTLSEPGGWLGERRRILDVAEPLYWLRCVVTAPGYEVPPQFDALRTNIVPVAHRTEHTGEVLTRTDGGSVTSAQPGQTFAFDQSPVLSATVTVGGEEWTAVPDFGASGPDDRHYVLDHERGTVRFGDGVLGEVPTAGQAVVAERYVHGGGRAGNVGASATWRFVDPALQDVGATPLSAATGGEDAESLDAALARLKRGLKRPYRLVTREDVRYVTEHTPGLRFGRATVRIGDPDGTGRRGAPVGTGRRGSPGEADRRDSAGETDRRGSPDGTATTDGCAPLGTLRVVVVPFSTGPRPVPSEGFLEAVRCHLERHRLLTDEMTVEPPEYVGVRVDVTVAIESGYAERQRTAAIQKVLDRFLDPLSGFDGEGWPFGRPVYLSELYEVVEGVEGVDCVHDISVSARGEFTMKGGDVHIADTALVFPLSHGVRVRSEGDRCGGWS